MYLSKISVNNIRLYAFMFLLLLAQAYATATGNYVFPLLVYAAFIFIYLFYINKTVLLFLILSTRILLDSISHITYPKLIFGLSSMEYFTFGLMVFMLIYLLAYKALKLDPISKSMTLVLAAMLLTTVCHGNIADLIEVGSLWLYFILAYIFFKYLLRDIHIKQTLIIIVITALYPFINQLYSIIMGTGHMHLGYLRYGGTYHHPLMLSYYFLMAIPASVYLLIRENRVKYRVFYIVAIAMFHFGAFMAGYRTTWMSILTFWTCYLVFVSRKKMRSIILVFIIVIFAWNLIGELLISKLLDIQTIMQNLGNIANLDNYQYNALLTGRIGLWKSGLEAYFQSSFQEKILGLGLNSVSNISFSYMHNEYLSALVETGAIGLICLFIWIFTIIKVLISYNITNKTYYYIILAIFVSFLVTAAGTMPFRNIRIMNYMALYLATISSYTSSSLQSDYRSTPT